MVALASSALPPVSRSVPTEQEGRTAQGDGRLRFFLMLVLVVIVSSVCMTWRIGLWSWDIDEVWSLRELGLLDQDKHLLENPNSQVARLPRLVPVWYACQGMVLRYLPITEGNSRLLPASCAILAVVAAFIWGARRYNLNFAACLSLFMVGSPLLLAQAQENRFYTMALLFLVLANIALFSRMERTKKLPLLLSVVFALLAVLSHSLLVVYFVLAAGAALASRWIVPGSTLPLRRFLATALACVLLYFFYVRPLARGWNSGLRPSMGSALLSAISETTIPVLSLAFVGAVAVFTQKQDTLLRVWALLAVLTTLAIAALPAVIWFNAQYMLLFLLPFWVLAAHTVSELGARLGRGPLAWSWYLAVILLLLPRVASYYQDGSRKDLRAASSFVTQYAAPEDLIYCNLPQVLQFYLPGRSVNEWKNTESLPESEVYVVFASNGWDPPLQINGKTVETLARIGKRRFDEQAYVVSIYRVSSR